jgi:ArsR family transcriptional regulator
MKHEQIAEKLKALAHPVRLRIVSGLLKNECNVSEIQKSLGLPQSTISQHLRLLKNAGIIKGRREGTKICYKVLNNLVKKIITVTEKE